MTAVPYRFGLKLVNVGSRSGILLQPRVNIFETRTAYISSKSSRTEEVVKPKPWPYKERGYSNIHSLFFDGTYKRMGENSKVIIVEGLPAIGKTDVAKTLAEEFEMQHFPMVTPDSMYQNPYGFDMRKLNPKLPKKYRLMDINDFSKNPKDDRSPALQFQFFYSKWEQYMDALAHLLNTGQGVVLERSFFSDCVFMEAMFQFNYINSNERKGYNKWYKIMMEEMMRPHLVVYLDASPSTVEENLRQRGQGEEKAFTKEFLQAMDYQYKQNYLKNIGEHAEVLVYDWNTPGESELIVEDIERIAFPEYEEYNKTQIDAKFEDWRIKDDQDWCEKRWMFTDNRNEMQYMVVHEYIKDVPRLIVTGEDRKHHDEVMDSAPGNEYDTGYNASQGDTGILFKTRSYPFGVK